MNHDATNKLGVEGVTIYCVKRSGDDVEHNTGVHFNFFRCTGDAAKHTLS